MTTQASVSHVLIIDDLDQSRHLLRSMLEEQGFRVAVTSDGQTGLERLQTSRHPVVALISNVLADYTATEMLRHIARDRELARRHAYILMTLSPDAARRALAHVRRHVPALLMENPHDLERLCAAAAEAAGRLLSVRPTLTVH